MPVQAAGLATVRILSGEPSFAWLEMQGFHSANPAKLFILRFESAFGVAGRNRHFNRIQILKTPLLGC